MSLWVMGGGAEDAIRSSGEPSIPDDLLRCTERPGRVESRCGAPHRRGPRANPPYTAQIDVCVPGHVGFELPDDDLPDRRSNAGERTGKAKHLHANSADISFK
jgi:hypothetical protein